MKPIIFTLSIFWGLNLYAQVNLQNITIARDVWGVPHIFSKTDAEAAYGLAWAHAEDDFKSIQENLLAGRGRLAEAKGKKEALFDFALQFFKIDSLVAERYEKDLSPEYRSVVAGYVQGLNDYAKKYPKKVLLPAALPFKGQDVIAGYTLNLTLMAGAGLTIKALDSKMAETVFAPNEMGSNALAISNTRSEDGKTWLLGNSHQPIEGRVAWYEAHICSEAGWNIIGGLFPGGMSIFVGANQHLGWAHTTNYHNFGDVFELEINPKNKKQYRYLGEWKNFTKRKAKLKVKILGMKIPISKSILETELGPVFQKDDKFYALRFPGSKDIRAGEQWFKMNKAQSFEAFETALKMEAIPLFNVVYADKEHNIFMSSLGIFPKRNPDLDWTYPIKKICVGHKCETNISYELKPRYLNPDCGFVYNCNNTPLHATCNDMNWKGDYWMGLQLFDYNRGEVMRRYLNSYEGKFSWNDFRKIKYDVSYSKQDSYYKNFRKLYELDEAKYPDLKVLIAALKTWDLRGDSTSTGATVAMLTHHFLQKENELPFAFLMIQKEVLEESELVKALQKTKDFMQKKYGSLQVPLGQVQRLIRGDKSYAINGLSEVMRACDSKLYDKKKGIFRMKSGDGYMQMLKFSELGVEIQSVNAYGASADPKSPHYNDQMELFVKEQTKTMTFDKELILKEAKRVYRPGE